ncbi:hypothetical protein ANN_06346 [Periplaneta americana]|uniref:Reverse transcriptase zinc-binding domain-containing protein n=1 Tax=Periplaneta americana TaxID=6978 RepID=A0ABQ8TDB3_PERAM|nr:hypothetical protein ANN_06346 [Periplaneta americana]
MAGLCEGGNEPPGSLKASNQLTSEPQKRYQQDTTYEATMPGDKIFINFCSKISPLPPLKQYPGANKWICKHEGLSNSEWRDGIKMVGNVAAVRAVPGRSQDNRCRHCHNEVETLAHVLGSCPHGEAMRNARHHQVRSIIAAVLKDVNYNPLKSA